MIKGLSLLTLLLPTLLLAQTPEVFKPDTIRRAIRAVPILNSLRVDGIMNEPEWNLANPEAQVIQIETHQGQLANFLTELRALYNSIIYISEFFHATAWVGRPYAQQISSDFDYKQHDLVTLAFDGFNDRRNAMMIATNAFGAQRDLLSFDDLYYDLDWDGLWRVRTPEPTRDGTRNSRFPGKPFGIRNRRTPFKTGASTCIATGGSPMRFRHSPPSRAYSVYSAWIMPARSPI
jgi:hypothetical protein